ncbi:DUF397 domain-containing protein [Streptomyces sp. NPDC001848]|uniref:DUF397 domain-containing protein n=1 Tax=Streptomyces sp. NPDC001848 TaxID=3364618 RepID=UPI003681C923
MTAAIANQWFKSSYSGGSGTECVECALALDGMLVRDSKLSGGPVISVGDGAWRFFVGAVRQTALPVQPSSRQEL